MAEGFEEATGSDLRLESAILTTLGTRDKQGTGKSPCGVQVGDGGRGLGWQQQEEGGQQPDMDLGQQMLARFQLPSPLSLPREDHA